MRKYYLDNIRWVCILLLFPYHVFTMYNNWGEDYYVRGQEVDCLSIIVKVCQPWFMPLLFVIAGASTVYALKKRSAGAYLAERVKKLLVPLAAGLLLIVPSLTYFAERFHNGYTGGYFEQYLLFFSKTDLIGYTGGFTPAHLWFLAYLFVVSILALPLVLLWKKRGRWDLVQTMPLAAVVLLFFVIWTFSYILNLSGKSVGRYFALFLLGAVVLSQDEIQQKLERYRWLMAALWGAATLPRILMDFTGPWEAVLFHFTSWVGILAAVGLGKRYLSFHNRCTAFFSRASFPVYLFHLAWVTAAAYYLMPVIHPVWAQVTAVLAVSVPLTFLTAWIAKWVPGLRLLFGIKSKF